MLAHAPRTKQAIFSRHHDPHTTREDQNSHPLITSGHTPSSSSLSPIYLPLLLSSFFHLGCIFLFFYFLKTTQYLKSPIMADQSPKPALPQKPQLSDQTRPMTTQQAIRLLSAATIAALLLFISGLTLTGTVISLVIATPLLVLFSPILVPGGIVMFLAGTGFLLSGVFGVASLTVLSWLYNYVTGKQPPGSEQIDYARMKMATKAKDLKERAKEYGQYMQSKTQEAASQQQGTQAS